MEHNGLYDAYVRHLDELLNRPRFRNAPRGFSSGELIGVSYVIADPRRRVVPMRVRQSNLVFNFAEALWYYAGRDEFGYLSYYAPGIARFVSGAHCLTGTAYGPRIFRFGAGAVDQWASVERTLGEDPDSRRAVIQIFRPEELLVAGNPDVACTLALQFLIRDGSLHLVGYMRANDVYRGMVSDVFSFTLLQELMARRLGLRLGGYTHMVGSLHLYDPDAEAARRVLAEAGRPPEVPDRMPAMPHGDPRPWVARVMDLEERLRTDTYRIDRAQLQRIELPDYWRQVVILFELHRQVRYGGGRHTDVLLDSLIPLYRHMLVSRFPSLSPGPAAEVVA